LPFDRTLDVGALEEDVEKEGLVARVPQNLKTIRALVQKNRQLWQNWRRKSVSEKKKLEALQTTIKELEG